jgi:hypothetical protein
LVPANEGRLLGAALKQQHQQLAELQSVLTATTNVVALQAAQIARLQRQASEAEQCHRQQERVTAAAGPADGGSTAGDAAAQPTPRPASPAAAAGSSASRDASGRCSPAALGLLARPRTAGAGGQGMAAVLKSDLEAYRAK